MFDSIENNYGKILTRHALGFITFSVEGLNDVEMIDLLSLNDHVLNEVFQYADRNIRRLPSHVVVWFQLKLSLQDLIIEQQNGCMNWYHRQLKEIAIKRFHENEILNFHYFFMSDYFGNQIPLNVQQSKMLKIKK